MAKLSPIYGDPDQIQYQGMPGRVVKSPPSLPFPPSVAGREGEREKKKEIICSEDEEEEMKEETCKCQSSPLQKSASLFASLCRIRAPSSQEQRQRDPLGRKEGEEGRPGLRNGE